MADGAGADEERFAFQASAAESATKARPTMTHIDSVDRRGPPLIGAAQGEGWFVARFQAILAAMTSVGSLEALDPPGGVGGGGRAGRHEIQRGDSLTSAAGQGRDARGERLRTRTLIVMRLLAVVGQAGALAILTVGLKIKAPVLPCFLLIGASAVLNLVLMAAPISRRFARPWEAAAQLVFDTVQLGGLLYFTGGVANPFCVLMIVPVTVAGATLPERYALPIGILSAWLIVVLAITALPLPWIGGHALHLPVLYRVGWVLALLLVMGVTAGFAFWTAGQTARMERALLATETVLAREQRLSALGALAAAAAHELGTPLATISVVAKELAHVTEAGPRREDAFLLVAEAQRCRGILSRLAESPETADTMRERMSLAQLLEEVTAPFKGDKRVRIVTEVEGPEKVEAPQMWRQREVVHALTAFVENAFDFAKKEIEVTAHYTARHITLQVRDDGAGFAPEILDRLGEPYVTTRPGAEGSRSGHIGMGLGFFISKTLLERTEARVEFRNARQGGALVSVRWSRSGAEAIDPDLVA